MVTEKSCNQNNEQTSLKKKEVEPVEPVLKNIYQSNTYRKDLSWPHFNDEPRVQEKLQVKDQQSCRFVFVACQTITSSNQGHKPRLDNNIPYMDVWQIYRGTEQSQEKETSQNFIEQVQSSSMINGHYLKHMFSILIVSRTENIIIICTAYPVLKHVHQSIMRDLFYGGFENYGIF